MWIHTWFLWFLHFLKVIYLKFLRWHFLKIENITQYPANKHYPQKKFRCINLKTDGSFSVLGTDSWFPVGKIDPKSKTSTFLKDLLIFLTEKILTDFQHVHTLWSKHELRTFLIICSIQQLRFGFWEQKDGVSCDLLISTNPL